MREMNDGFRSAQSLLAVCLSSACNLPLSVSSRPLEAKTGIGLSFSLFEPIFRPLYAANPGAFPMPSRGGGTSLDQAILTKTLRPSDIGTGLSVCSRVDVASRCSTLDFMQKPGEGEMLMVTLEEAMVDELSPAGPEPPIAAVFTFTSIHFIVSDWDPPLARESSRTHLFSPSHRLSRRLESFNIDADMARPSSEAQTVPQTPMPNIDDDLSMQKYISDRRVIGVMALPSAHSCSHYMRPV